MRVIKLDAGTGATKWTRDFEGCGRVVALNGTGHVYVGGHSGHGLQDPSHTSPPLFTQIGGLDAYVLKMDAGTGAIAWATNFGGPTRPPGPTG